jgi:hypothetical protein
MTANYYTYLYLRLDDTPYYVGKGKSYRMISSNHGKHITVPTDRTRIVIVAHNLFEHEALLLESKLITHYGRKVDGTGILHNLTPKGKGGGVKGHPPTNTKPNKTSFKKGIKKSPESAAKAASGHIGLTYKKTEKHDGTI